MSRGSVAQPACPCASPQGLVLLEDPLPGSPLDALLVTLLELVVGGLGALLLTEWRGEVTRGFVRLAALCIAPLALLAWLVPGERPWPAGPLVLLALAGSVAYFVYAWASASFRPPAAVFGLAAVLAGALAMGIVSWSVPAPAGRPAQVLGLAADTLVLGGATVGLVLGHWYLVTPRLTARPLRRLVDWLLIGVVLEGVVVAWPLLRAVDLSLALGDVLLWGQLTALVALPAIVGVAARACCKEWPRGRALQAATGLLYIATGSVMGGVLLSNMLRFATPGPA